MTTAMFINTSNNKAPQPLRRHSCQHLLRQQNNGGLFTAHSGRSVIKRQCQSTIMGGAWQNYVTLPRICEQLDLRKSLLFMGIEKKHRVDLYHYRVVVCTHCQHTFLFRHHVKMNFASDVPFKKCALCTSSTPIKFNYNFYISRSWAICLLIYLNYTYYKINVFRAKFKQRVNSRLISKSYCTLCTFSSYRLCSVDFVLISEQCSVSACQQLSYVTSALHLTH